MIGVIPNKAGGKGGGSELKIEVFSEGEKGFFATSLEAKSAEVV